MSSDEGFLRLTDWLLRLTDWSLRLTDWSLRLTDWTLPLTAWPCRSPPGPAAHRLVPAARSLYLLKPSKKGSEMTERAGISHLGDGTSRSRCVGSLVWRCILLAGFARNIEKAPRSMSSRGLSLRSSVFCLISLGAYVCRSATLDPRCRFTS